MKNWFEMYRGTEGTSKNLNTFFKLINITVDSTIVTVNLMLVQSLIRRLYNRRIDASTIVESTLVQP